MSSWIYGDTVESADESAVVLASSYFAIFSLMIF